MTITSLPGFGGITPRQNIQTTSVKLQAALANLFSSQPASDVADVSVASQLQAQTSGLKQASLNLAQTLSLTQVADGGAEHIQGTLKQLKSLASQSSSSDLTAEERTQLDQQFQDLVGQVDSTVANTSFDGKNLLNGTLSGDNSPSLDNLLATSGGGDLSIDSLSTANLFGGTSLDILSADNAGQSGNILDSALGLVAGARDNIGAFQDAVSYAAANVDSAISNQEAAQSSLSDADLAVTSSSSAADIQNNVAAAIAAQGNRLSPALLQLIG